jgi:hypothetical protein
MKQLKWEQKFWFFDNKEEEIEARCHSNPDYINHPKGLEKKVMIGPDSLMSPYDFNTWIAHTNFRLDKKDAITCSAIPGVEYFNFVTPYRFQVCIGKLFCGEDVRQQIKNKLCTEPPSPEKPTEQASVTYSVNGIITRITGPDKEELTKQVPAEAKVIQKSW